MAKDAPDTIVVKKREGKFRNAQKQAVIPANIFGQGKESQAITLDRQSFDHYMKFQYQGGMIYLNIEEDKKKEPVIIDEVQTHPYKAITQHVNFRRVNLKEEIEQDVEITLTGEADAGELKIVQVVQEVTVSALPTNIPESIEVDISWLKTVDDKITLKDLKAPAGVTIVMDEDTEDNAVVVVHEHEEEVEVDTTLPTEEVPATQQTADETAEGKDKKSD